MSSKKLSSLMDGSVSFFLIRSSCTAFSIAFATCMYLGVADRLSMLISSMIGYSLIIIASHFQNDSIHIGKARPRNWERSSLTKINPAKSVTRILCDVGVRIRLACRYREVQVFRLEAHVTGYG